LAKASLDGLKGFQLSVKSKDHRFWEHPRRAFKSTEIFISNL